MELYPVHDLVHQPGNISRMLAEDKRLLGHRERTSLLPAEAAASASHSHWFLCYSGQRRCPRRTPAPGVGRVTSEERGAWDAEAFMVSGNKPALCLGEAVSSFPKVTVSTALRDAPGESSQGLEVLKNLARMCRIFGAVADGLSPWSLWQGN